MPRKTKTPFPMETFLRRLGLLRLQYGLTKDVDFHRAVGLQGTGRWKNPDHKMVETDTLLLIAQYFNVSIDWLLGRQALEPSAPLTAAESALSYAAHPLDLNETLLADIIALVHQVIKRRRLKFTHKQQAILIARLYADCAESHTSPSLLQVERNLLFAQSLSTHK